MSELKEITHINYPDKFNRVYCRQFRTLRTMDKDGKFWNICLKCPYFSGDYQGQGVECTWNDFNQQKNYTTYVSDPSEEMLRVSRLIDAKVIEK